MTLLAGPQLTLLLLNLTITTSLSALTFVILGGGFANTLRHYLIQSHKPWANRQQRRRMTQAFVKTGNINKATGHLVAKGQLRGASINCFLDDGAEASMVARSLVMDKDIKDCDYGGLVGIGDGVVRTYGCATVVIEFGGKTFPVEAAVVDDKAVPITQQILLGMDWHRRHNPIKDYRDMTFKLKGSTKKIYAGQKIAPDLAPQEVSPKGVPQYYLSKFPKLFSEPTELPPLRPGLDMELTLRKGPDGKDLRPAESREIRIRNPIILAKLAAERTSLLAKGFITAEPNPIVPPCHAFGVVNPHDDNGNRRENLQVTPDLVRIVYDFVKLNAVLELLPSILPVISEVVNRVALALRSPNGCATTVDLRAGFHNNRMHPNSARLTAFYFPGNSMCYYWNVMPMGLAGAPGAFQRLMRAILAEFIEEGGLEIYLDDLTIHGQTKKEHDERLERILQHLQNNHFHLKPSKCRIGQRNIELLGFHISPQGAAPLNSHVQGIVDFVFPSTVQQWQRFHGMMNFYRRHIPRFSDIMKPIASIMGLTKEEIMRPDAIKGEARKKLAKAVRDKDPCLRTAFEEAKKVMINATRNSPLDPSRTLYYITDASKVAWGGVFTHDPSFKKEDPVAWLSGTFKTNEKSWHSSHREIFGVIGAIQRYPEYFGHHVHVLTDSTHLRDWASLDITSERLARWHELLMTHNITFTHIDGQSNVVADALSRHILENNDKWEGKVIAEKLILNAAACMLRVVGRPARPTGPIMVYSARKKGTSASPHLTNCETISNEKPTRQKCINDILRLIQSMPRLHAIKNKSGGKTAPPQQNATATSPGGKAESTTTPVFDNQRSNHSNHSYQGHWSKCRECARTSTTLPANEGQRRVQTERALDEKRPVRVAPCDSEFRRDWKTCAGKEQTKTLGISHCEIKIPPTHEFCTACSLTNQPASLHDQQKCPHGNPWQGKNIKTLCLALCRRPEKKGDKVLSFRKKDKS